MLRDKRTFGPITNACFRHKVTKYGGAHLSLGLDCADQCFSQDTLPARVSLDPLPVSWNPARLRSTLSSLLIPANWTPSSRRGTFGSQRCTADDVITSSQETIASTEYPRARPETQSSLVDSQAGRSTANGKQPLHAWGLNSVQSTYHNVQRRIVATQEKIKAASETFQNDIHSHLPDAKALVKNLWSLNKRNQ